MGGVFSDAYTDRDANKLYSKFIAGKIRERVHDPVVAEALIPKTYCFSTRRVPLESGYFEACNQPNVHLVDLQKTPALSITKAGIMTLDGTEHELDVLVYATGFDAITGAFSAIEIRGKINRPLMANSRPKEADQAIWLDHRPRTFLGIMTPSMPNMFNVLGPRQPFGNATRNIENVVNVVMDLLQYSGTTIIHALSLLRKRLINGRNMLWSVAKANLANEVDSWMTGVNKNVEGKTIRNVARYAGHVAEYRRQCKKCKDNGYDGLVVS